jgi:hypothetical protein
MSKKGGETGEGFVEGGTRVFRNLHVLGVVALGGAAIVFPEFAAPLAFFAVAEGLHAGILEGVRRFVHKRRSPQPA